MPSWILDLQYVPLNLWLLIAIWSAWGLFTWVVTAPSGAQHLGAKGGA